MNNKSSKSKFHLGNKRNNSIGYNIYLMLFSLLLMAQSACKNLITVDPPITTINADNVYGKDETAIAVITNIYAQISGLNHTSFNTGQGNMGNISLVTGLSSDELTLFYVNNLFYNSFYSNSLSADKINTGIWSNVYSFVFTINSAIKGLTGNKTLSSKIQSQLLGEAKFLRAFCYFYLVNLYGNIPMVLTTDPIINSKISNSDPNIIYDQIIADLIDAKSLLDKEYLAGNLINTTSERVRPTKWAASALLSRVYLFNKNFSGADQEASILIDSARNSQAIFQLDSLNGVFLRNSNECIWQIQNVYNTGGNTGDGQTYILPSNGPNTSNYPVYLSKYVLNSFEAGDMRRGYWVDSVVVDSQVYYFPFKYKLGALTSNGVNKECLMMLRLGEQYLIRAEARAELGEVGLSRNDLNVIRKRSGLSEISSSSKEELLSAIFHERQVELFTEWGNRWLDLKRTNNVNEVMTKVTPIKGGQWNPNWQLYPIPLGELKADPFLIQNPGY